jgi:ATP-binding cassette, subfamily A (ABC1), member 3
MFAPSSGTAYLNGHDITTETVQARASLGLCPQHNMLIDDLTVGEHITFFCRLKGVNSQQEISREIEKYTDLLGLNDKIKALSKTLSGGQKRKLSIGVALCGNSKIVVLDEPTSGLDAGAKRGLWNLLISEKKGRTILLTTHHMDEADVLGDRIAIMNEGELQTVGSSYFLKKRYGSGYKLICVKKQGCKPEDILSELRHCDPSASMESNAQIEEKSEELKVSSFGCSLTSLEEVFIKVGSQHDGSEQKRPFKFSDIIPSKKVTGVKLFTYQAYAMLLKQFHYTRRNLYSIGWLTIISAFLTYVLLSAPIEFDQFFERNNAPFRSTRSIIEHDGSQTGIATAYASLFSEKDQIVQIEGAFEDHLFARYQISMDTAFEQYLIGVTLKENEISAWFRGLTYQTFLQCVSLNTVSRAVLKSIAGTEYDIRAFNRPFNNSNSLREPRQTDEDHEELTPEEDLSFTARITNFMLIFFLFFMLLVYWPAIFISIKVKERVTRAKLLQFISGANRFTYWLTSFLIDYVIFLAIIYIFVGIIALTQRPYFRTIEQLGTLMVIFSFYGLAIISFIYALSFMFDKYSTAETFTKTYGLLCE